MKNVTIVTTTQLEEILLGMDNTNAQFSGLVTFTEPKITKKDRVTKEPHGFTSVKKLTRLKMLVNVDYKRSVLAQLEREDKEATEYKEGKNTMPIDFELSNNGFCGLFRGNAVLVHRPMKYYATKYVANGKMIDKEKLGDILPTHSKATNQGTDKEIEWRKLYVKNIRRININGERYKVVNA